MSDYTVIKAVSDTILQILKDGITNNLDPQLHGVQIDLRSPKEMRQANNTPGVSLWLYRITRDADLLNVRPERISPTQSQRTPLPIHLYYLVTPLVVDAGDRQTLIGRVMQLLNDHAILRGAELQDSLMGANDEFRVTLETLTLEELTRIWFALSEPYDLSISYEIQVVRIDSDFEAIYGAPVVSRKAGYAQIEEVL